MRGVCVIGPPRLGVRSERFYSATFLTRECVALHRIKARLQQVLPVSILA